MIVQTFEYFVKVLQRAIQTCDARFKHVHMCLGCTTIVESRRVNMISNDPKHKQKHALTKTQLQTLATVTNSFMMQCHITGFIK